MASNKTIVLKGHGVRNEAVANAAITPGHLVELMSTGKLRVHASAGQNCEKAFAVEDDLQGNTIDDAYDAADIAQYNIMKPGDEVNALLANGQDVSIGDFLESAGDGTLQAHTADSESLGADSSGAIASFYTNQIVGVALEAVDMSDSSGADPSARIKVRIV